MPTLWLLRFQLQIATLPRKQWPVHILMQTVAWGIVFCLGTIMQTSVGKEATVLKQFETHACFISTVSGKSCEVHGVRPADSLANPRPNLCVHMRPMPSFLRFLWAFRSITVVRSSSNCTAE